jgi:hypothetical protein
MTTIQATSSASFCSTPAVNTSNPTHASTSVIGGKAVFENDNYRITAGDDNTVNIYNKNNGETTHIWGDPHVNIDGKHEFDFWGTTTFALEDGTKVTIETVTAGNGMTLASEVNITNGDYGVQISGVDTNKRGDLKINEAAGWGEVLDWTHDDGNVLQENPAGKGYLAVDSNGQIQKVDQAYINKTDLQKNPGLDPATQQRAGEFAQNLLNAFSGLVSLSFSGAFLGALAGAFDAGGDARRAPDTSTRDANRFSLTVFRLEF